jgi:hypothetical protein
MFCLSIIYDYDHAPSALIHMVFFYSQCLLLSCFQLKFTFVDLFCNHSPLLRIPIGVLNNNSILKSATLRPHNCLCSEKSLNLHISRIQGG